MNPRTFFILALFPVLGATGVCEAGPQTATPVPARLPVRSTVPGNPTNQAASEPAQTKIVQIYRGEGYFDNALAEKLRSKLTGKSESATRDGKSAL